MVEVVSFKPNGDWYPNAPSNWNPTAIITLTNIESGLSLDDLHFDIGGALIGVQANDVERGGNEWIVEVSIYASSNVDISNSQLDVEGVNDNIDVNDAHVLLSSVYDVGDVIVPEEYPDDCTPYARVIVEGNDIPVINGGVETEIKIDGPMDINKISTVYTPAQWDGVNIQEHIRASNLNNDNLWQPIDVQYLDPETEEYYTVHRGYLQSFGAGSKGTLERRIRVGDIGMLLESIPFSGSYTIDSTVGDILEDIVDTFEEHQPVFEVVELSHSGELIDSERAEQWEFDASGGFGSIAVAIADQIPDSFGLKTLASFSENHDTLKDAMDFVTSKLSGEFYFAPIDNDQRHISLVYDEDRTRNYHEVALEGNNNLPQPVMIKNNALYEIQPVNTVQVHGSPKKGAWDKTRDVVVDVNYEYPMAKARHTKLYEQVGGYEYKPPIKEPPGVTSLEGAETYAIEQLIDEIEGGGMGEIITYMFPYIEPHDTLRCRPACNMNIEEDAVPLTYSVEAVTHKVGYDDDTGNLVRKTFLRVNTEVSEDDIEIVESDEIQLE